MAVKKKVSKKQLLIYVEYVEKNEILRTGKLVPGMPPNTLNLLWQEITDMLNNCGDGAVREAEKWKTTFVEWKSQVRKRARDGKKELTEVEKRFLKATGVVVVEGLQNVPEMCIPSVTNEEQVINVEDGQNLEFNVENIPIVFETGILTDANEPIDEDDNPIKEKTESSVLFRKTDKKVLRKRKSKNTPLLEQYVKGQEAQNEGFRAIAASLSEIAASINNLAEVIRNKE